MIVSTNNAASHYSAKLSNSVPTGYSQDPAASDFVKPSVKVDLGWMDFSLAAT